jgi:hypothetical protein
VKITKAQPRTVPATPANDQGQRQVLPALQDLHRPGLYDAPDLTLPAVKLSELTQGGGSMPAECHVGPPEAIKRDREEGRRRRYDEQC